MKTPPSMLFRSNCSSWPKEYKQLKELIHTKDLFQSVTVTDYLFTKCLLFAKVNLPEERISSLPEAV